MTGTQLRNKSEGQISLAAALPPGTSVLPHDFEARLVYVKKASGLSWNALAEKLGVDPRQIARWRKGVEPSGGAMLALLRLAAFIPGGTQALLGVRAPSRAGQSKAFLGSRESL